MTDTTNLIGQANLAMMQGQKDTAPKINRNANLEQIRKTAEDFETMMISQMLRPMFEGLSTEAPFGGGHAEKMWRDVMVDEMSKEMTKAGGIGVTDQVMREMLKMQEEGNNGR
ncbi:MAG: rod-binding protein [Alphaproteobacteria bacterium]|nr:rod-binding protein [Rhodospirillales bacterium]MCW9045826.1 rod-binding protein [Alphaproteobacteria bacterium]